MSEADNGLFNAAQTFPHNGFLTDLLKAVVLFTADVYEADGIEGGGYFGF